jgi:hypothetical protein
MVARVLNLCGLSLGAKEQIHRTGEDNVEGYWENEFFVDLDERLLAALGSAWDLACELPAGWERSPSLEPLRAEARRLASSFAGQEPWGWKDPRATRLLPFWRSVLPDLRVVVCVRDPREVALSLNSRARSSLLFGVRLWHEYYQHLAQHTTAGERLVVSYATVLAEPDGEMERLVSFAGLRASDAAHASIKTALRHHDTLRSGVAVAVAPETEQLYASLLREAALPPPSVIPMRLPSPETPIAWQTVIAVDLAGESLAVRERVDLVPVRTTAEATLYEATSNDPKFVLNVPPFRPSSVRGVRFRMRRGTKGTAVAQLFWTHEPGEAFSEQRSAVALVEPENAGWCEYAFRFDRSPFRERWQGGAAIAALRFDPINVMGPVELASLEFLS